MAEDQRTLEMQATTLSGNQAAQAQWNDKAAREARVWLDFEPRWPSRRRLAVGGLREVLPD